MKKNLIAIIALTAALAASTSAFAETVQISEEELNKPVSTYAPDAMPTPEIQGDIMVLNGEETDAAAPVETASFISDGLFRMVFANCWILAGIVAENMIVCRSFGKYFTICIISS